MPLANVADDGSGVGQQKARSVIQGVNLVIGVATNLAARVVEDKIWNMGSLALAFTVG